MAPFPTRKWSIPRSAGGLLRWASLGCVAALGAPDGRGQDGNAGLSVTATPTYVSQYLFRGLRLGGQSLQPSVEADAGRLTLGVWASTPLAGKVPGQSDPEIDPYGSYAVRLSKAVSLQPGFTVYTFPRAPAGRGFFRSAFEPYLGLSSTAAGDSDHAPGVLRPCPEGNDPGDERDLGRSARLPRDRDRSHGDRGQCEQLDAVNGASPGVTARGGYWLLGAAVPVQVASHLKLSAGWAYSEGTGASLQQGSRPKVANPASAGRGIFTASAAWTF